MDDIMHTVLDDVMGDVMTDETVCSVLLSPVCMQRIAQLVRSQLPVSRASALQPLPESIVNKSLCQYPHSPVTRSDDECGQLRRLADPVWMDVEHGLASCAELRTLLAQAHVPVHQWRAATWLSLAKCR
eukprot:scpid43497/ scgid23183/ 